MTLVMYHPEMDEINIFEKHTRATVWGNAFLSITNHIEDTLAGGWIVIGEL